MNTRLIARTLIGVVVLLALGTNVVLAGGWAVITLDELPAQITTGQALPIGFTVRQHGQTLRSDLKPIVRFDRSDTQESFHVTAQRQGTEGHYVAEIKFPSAGQWDWQVDIEQFGMITQPMPALSVKAAQAAALTKAMPAQAQLPALALIQYVIRAISQMLPNKISAVTDSAQTLPLNVVATKVDQDDQVARGKALFSAKGCVMCHSHDAVNKGQPVFWSGEASTPDLTVNQFTAEYLRSWLKDPASIKPNTSMPNLHLKLTEIEALIAFLQTAR
jgi:cytochrome c2